MFQEGKSNHKFRDTKGLLSQNFPHSDIWPAYKVSEDSSLSNCPTFYVEGIPTTINTLYVPKMLCYLRAQMFKKMFTAEP